MDIKDKWKCEGFDAVIGNPPYECRNATGDNKLYLEFIKYSLEKLYKNGDIKKNSDSLYKYMIIDKINKGHPFPGVYYYNNYQMIDYGKPKIIMCSGGYLMPSFDKKGIYNLSDNMLYLLINDLSEYNGLNIIINSVLINYLNKVTMTDNIHGRDTVIKNIKQIDLSKIKCENDIYNIMNITNDELELMKHTIQII